MAENDLRKPDFLTPEALERWIPKLRDAGLMYKFYKTPEWLDLRERVLRANHWECEDCRARSPARITRAVTVHHDRPVQKYPGLALATYYIGEDGKKHQQLFALCEDCHNARHERFGHKLPKGAENPLTPERW